MFRSFSRSRKRAAALAIAMFATGPSWALNNDDYAATMGALWRLREPLCPRLAFDPEAYVTALHIPGGTADAVRRRFRRAFDRGYAMAGEWLADGTAQFCANVEQFFDGKHDIFGNVKTSPEPPPPGLIIR